MESLQHWRSKIRLEKILLESGWSICYHDGDVSFSFRTYKGDRTYWPDLLAYKDEEGYVAFEVDGHKGHSSKRDFEKMRLRDSTMHEVDIRTVRIQMSDLAGKRKQDDSLIREEIEYQLQ